MSTTTVHLSSSFMVVCFFVMVTSFNIDTKYPQYFEFPQNSSIFLNEARNYFGYSVGLLKNKEGYHALVTAPRANSSIVGSPLYEPGALFKCQISFANRSHSCTEVLLDAATNNYTDAGEEFSYRDRKDRMSLGVSLDIEQNSRSSRVVTCGHLWKNQLYYKFYLTNGVCYVINGELNSKTVQKLLPLVGKSKQFSQISSYYFYSYAQAGTSAVFSEDGTYLFLGTPGFARWRGTVVTYLNPANNKNYRNPSVPEHTAQISRYSYIGYSITSGKFFKGLDTLVATGAPRVESGSGQVYIVKARDVDSKKISVHMKVRGTQFCEYYGASVLGVNVNNDDFTDLLVGAPLHSLESGGDEGKVYVYISDGKALRKYAELYGESIPNARFGSCISSIGDINQDGCNDVAVGAPYEDSQGAVYVYHGTSHGINTQYAQRLQASKLSPFLQGFGISISRGLDVDNNYYPDILIGSHESSHAVLLRTYPVIKLIGKLDFSPQQINTNITSCNFDGKLVPCFNVTTCLQYTGEHSQLSSTFETELYIDYGRQNIQERSALIFETKRTSVIKRKFSANTGVYQCSTDIGFIFDVKDIITPVNFLFVYNLASDVKNRFCKSCPVIDQTTHTNRVSKSISFQTGCGTDNKCFADLKINASFVENPENLPLIIGENPSLTLNIDVINSGEPAYISELLIHLPPEITNINKDDCSPLSEQQKQTNATLFCNLGNPLAKNGKVRIQIKIGISKVPLNTDSLRLFLETKTGSLEIEPFDNDVELIIVFRRLMNISVRGISKPDLVQYDSIKQTPFPVSHTYIVINHGPTPVDEIDIEIHVPTKYRDEYKNDSIEFVSITNLQAGSSESLAIPARCNDSTIEVNPEQQDKSRSGVENFDEELVSQKGRNRTLRSISEEPDDNDDVQLTAMSSKVADHSDRKRTYIINCETFHCTVIRCTLPLVLDTRTFAKFGVTMQLNVSSLSDSLDSWHRIEFSTIAKVFITNEKGDIQPYANTPDKTSVKTIIIHPGPMPPEEVKAWIIYVSIGVGVLLLIIILIILIKIGFFKRQQKEKIRAMMAQTNQNERNQSLVTNEIVPDKEE